MKNAGLYLLVGALTAGNLGFRLADSPEPNVLQTTRLEVGDRVAAPALAALLDENRDGATCELVIAFSPDCPHCRAAAVAEKASGRSGPYAEPTWIGEVASERMSAFAEAMAASSSLEVSAEAFAALEVTAVPAAFLIDDDRVIRWRGPYQGSESSEELVARCENGAPQELMAAVPSTRVSSSD